MRREGSMSTEMALFIMFMLVAVPYVLLNLYNSAKNKVMIARGLSKWGMQEHELVVWKDNMNLNNGFFYGDDDLTYYLPEFLVNVRFVYQAREQGELSWSAGPRVVYFKTGDGYHWLRSAFVKWVQQRHLDKVPVPTIDFAPMKDAGIEMYHSAPGKLWSLRNQEYVN